MRTKQFESVLLATILILAATAHGRTWSVQRDGSGDFTVIQDAVDAASDGDVIEIGPGRFDEFRTIYNNSGMPLYDVYVNIEDKDLTLIGAGQDQTFLGPEDGSIHTRQSLIVKTRDSDLNLSGLLLENANHAVIWFEYGQFEMTGCVLRLGYLGFFGVVSAGGNINSCRFESFSGDGIAVDTPTPSLEVTECEFDEVHVGAGAYWSGARLDVSQCVVNGGVVGFNFSDNATGSVTGCLVTDCANYGVAVSTAQEVTIEDNHIYCSDTGGGIGLLGCNDLVVMNNIIEGGVACIYANSGYGELNFHQNHLFRAEGGYFAWTTDYWPYDEVVLDLSGNYWGTTDIEEIEEWTLDGNDFPNSNLYFNFLPLADGPVRTERATWGDVKSLFR